MYVLFKSGLMIGTVVYKRTFRLSELCIWTYLYCSIQSQEIENEQILLEDMHDTAGC